MQTTTKQIFLNYIIAISLVGIVLIALKDYFFATKNKSKQIVKSITAASVVSSNADPAIPCKSKYFPFKKGARWEYIITSTTETEEQKKSFKSLLTAQIVEASSSSVTLESRFDRKSKPIKTQLFCKKSGVYGFPFPLISTVDLSPLFASIRFLPPPDDIKINDDWQDVIDFSQFTPFPVPVPFILSHQIIDQYRGNIVIGTTGIFATDSLADLNAILLADKLFTYVLKEGAGIYDLNLDIHLQELGRLKTKVVLKMFNDGL